MRSHRRCHYIALAAEYGVHARTLRQAARDGRLKVSYSRESFFGKQKPLATRTAMEMFIRLYYRQTTRSSIRPSRPRVIVVPENYHAVLIGLRRRLSLTQAAFAAAVEAANKSVVYQWETRRRVPSPVFWKKAMALARRVPDEKQPRHSLDTIPE
jgi:hypothetical protein